MLQPTTQVRQDGAKHSHSKAYPPPEGYPNPFYARRAQLQSKLAFSCLKLTSLAERTTGVGDPLT